MSEPSAVVPLSALRKAIAARMVEAKRTIPHFRLVADFEMSALFAQREQFNIINPTDKVSLNDCVIKACASTLMEHPGVNIQLVGQEVHQYSDADISVVIAIEGGLATPVVRGANRMGLREIAAHVKSLAARAAARKLNMHDILGGTFSISNLGSYGVDQFDAIINPPQCAILAVGRARPRLLVLDNGETHVAKVLRATLSVDHRAIDGVTGAAFLATLRQKLEQPQELFAVDA